ncbi:dUTP diphosphatase [Enterococcus sp. DIV0242_7C1]|uniref:dUTP diphosphatase n=1 Tax=Candidatus Enterococcus dunnyi TaxID=1834192 RepID=A0A200IZA9_9ENTE|nr:MULTISPECIES: dUTP diphosphatase [unclassified Enterococcus]MBO0470317.1 dUTP diphosphatase [Enterococcus sp. DIV0242_7C1]MCA5014215.1 dUTP diphosphatase [Enterococcus sp. S23]MCA5017565.1 dUTP diphosphatase [Enterococcus sp. S22(2020)]OUZ30314.1 dUTP pyrophosphatase [Enterococcus sp. 9D6_DIV0238]
MKQRGFEIISSYKDQGISLPERATKGAAGYDFEAAEQVVVPSIWKLQAQGTAPKPVLVKTGIKAYMAEDEYLELVSRSSNPLKRFLMLANGVGVIDRDYYNNEGNEGHIMFQFINFGYEDMVIEKGERIGQGIFKPFLLADIDNVDKERTGGFGSSGKN